MPYDESTVSAGSTRRVAVVGAASQIGVALLPRLRGQEIEVLSIGRTARGEGVNRVYRFDPEQGCFDGALTPVHAVISLAPLPAIGEVLDMVASLGATRLIAFGSVSRFSKANSTSAIEREFVREQVQAEHVLRERANQAGVNWTLFRPSMIYGADLDLNVSFIKSTIVKYGVFPIPWGARGLRQPVHVEDLAAACVAVLDCERTFGRAYDLGGGETVAYPELVRRVFCSADKTPRILPVPLSLFYLLIALARLRSGNSFLRKEMADRMFSDLTVDNTPAAADFGFQPRAFSIG